MAKKSQVARDLKRIRLAARYAAKRAHLRKMMKDATIPPDQKQSIQEQYAKMPRNSSRVRLTRRCVLTGRARGYDRKTGLSRIALRELGLQGMLPGMRKASW